MTRRHVSHRSCEMLGAACGEPQSGPAGRAPVRAAEDAGLATRGQPGLTPTGPHSWRARAPSTRFHPACVTASWPCVALSPTEWRRIRASGTEASGNGGVAKVHATDRAEVPRWLPRWQTRWSCRHHRRPRFLSPRLASAVTGVLTFTLVKPNFWSAVTPLCQAGMPEPGSNH